MKKDLKNFLLYVPEEAANAVVKAHQGRRFRAILLHQLIKGAFIQIGKELRAFRVSLGGRDYAGVAGDSVFDLRIALDDFIGDRFK